MASGDTLVVFHPFQNEPPTTNYATLTMVAGVTGIRPSLAFDPGGTDEVAVFSGVLPRSYDGGGLTLTFWYSPAAASTTKDVIWTAAFERLVDGDDLDATGGSDFAAANTVTDTVPATAYELEVAAITFTDGADMDSVAAGDLFRLKVTRNSSSASDTYTEGDALLFAIEIKET